jgi:DNA repair exonuclease SbcCD ATPase subunit
MLREINVEGRSLLPALSRIADIIISHDSELIQIIDQMIRKESTMWKRGRYRIEALTELKQKLNR